MLVSPEPFPHLKCPPPRELLFAPQGKLACAQISLVSSFRLGKQHRRAKFNPLLYHSLNLNRGPHTPENVRNHWEIQTRNSQCTSGLTGLWWTHVQDSQAPVVIKMTGHWVHCNLVMEMEKLTQGRHFQQQFGASQIMQFCPKSLSSHFGSFSIATVHEGKQAHILHCMSE